MLPGCQKINIGGPHGSYAYVKLVKVKLFWCDNYLFKKLLGNNEKYGVWDGERAGGGRGRGVSYLKKKI